jgi:hypothetical protein
MKGVAMKFVLATTAIAAAMAVSPAFAQEASDQQASPAPRTGDGSVLVEGVKPSKVLGAIDTEQLVTPPQDADAAAPPLSIPEKTTSVTTIETPPDTAKPLVNIASVNVPLPQEVAAVAQNGKYTTKDLVKAQLMAMNSAPPIQQPVITTTTITYPNDAGTPDAPAAAGQGDQARTAEGTSGHAGDVAPLPSTGSSTPG